MQPDWHFADIITVLKKQGTSLAANYRTKFDEESVCQKAKNQPLGWFL
ncbi:hypothetical protein [Hafnia alvei]|uniref:Transcriptional regulator n=1 Tax=Hafnia alvei TaxID=569 RepID=A0A1C6YV24_HAFAL|nr:hypothetical protein [Hafnia alvei]NLS55339.1 hypothetical protein [Hafnia alvei]SCM50693.1 hypothetical protein BN1044_00141 [Hafnia alvei]